MSKRRGVSGLGTGSYLRIAFLAERMNPKMGSCDLRVHHTSLRHLAKISHGGNLCRRLAMRLFSRSLVL